MGVTRSDIEEAIYGLLTTSQRQSDMKHSSGVNTSIQNQELLSRSVSHENNRSIGNTDPEAVTTSLNIWVQLYRGLLICSIKIAGSHWGGRGLEYGLFLFVSLKTFDNAKDKAYSNLGAQSRATEASQENKNVASACNDL